MNATIAVTKEITTLINILTVESENEPKLIELLRENTENIVSRLDGWVSTSFIVAKDKRRIAIYSQWRDLASVEARDLLAVARLGVGRGDASEPKDARIFPADRGACCIRRLCR